MDSMVSDLAVNHSLLEDDLGGSLAVHAKAATVGVLQHRAHALTG